MTLPQHKTNFRRWVTEEYSPTIICSASKQVEEICSANGLTFAELLAPFGVLQEMSIPVRTVNKSYSLKDFRFRFRSMRDCKSIPKDEAEQLIEAYIKSEELKTGTPRMQFDRYRTALRETLRYRPYHTLDHPVAHLIAVSSQESYSQLQIVEALSNSNNLPGPFAAGAYDVNLSQYYVLVHDHSSGASDVEAVFEEMKNKLSSQRCFLIQVNSLPTDKSNSAQPDIWSSMFSAKAFIEDTSESALTSRNEPSKYFTYGARLNSDDLKSLQTFVHELCFESVLRDIEKTMADLNQKVTAQRKGLRNTFRLMWRKPKELVASDSDQQLSVPPEEKFYGVESIEFQVRFLADLAVMVQDYEMALSLYRIVRDDYTADKAIFHRAFTLEMMAICLFMTEGSKKQIQEYMQKALTDFQILPAEVRIGFFTCCTMTYADLLKSEGTCSSLSKAAEAYVKASLVETKVAAALLLEQSAQCILFAGMDESKLNTLQLVDSNGGVILGIPSRSTKWRKFCFRYVMAGSLFKQCRLYQDALRCYSVVKPLYNDVNWLKIQVHITYSLGMLLRSLNYNDRLHEILELWSEVLVKGVFSAAKESALIQEFKAEFSKHGSQDETQRSFDFGIPQINDNLTIVNSQANALIPPNSADESNNLNEGSWKVFESKLKSGGTMVGLDTINAIQVSYTDEPIYVDLFVVNPLQQQLELTDVQLWAELITDVDGKVPVEVTGLTLRLQAKEERWLRLSLVPRSVGVLEVYGLNYKLFGLFFVRRSLKIDGILVNKTKEERQNHIRHEDTRLKRHILSQNAWLGARLHGFPIDLVPGQIVSMQLEIINNGSQPYSGPISMFSNYPLSISTSNTMAMAQSPCDLEQFIETAGLTPGVPYNIPMRFQVLSCGHDSDVLVLFLLIVYNGNLERKRMIKLEFNAQLRAEMRMVAKSRIDDSIVPTLVSINIHNRLKWPVSLTRIMCNLSGALISTSLMTLLDQVEPSENVTILYGLIDKGLSHEKLRYRPIDVSSNHDMKVNEYADANYNFPPLGMDIWWIAEDIVGQTSLKVLYPDVSHESRLLVNIEYVEIIEHDFHHQKHCKLPIKLVIYNLSTEDLQDCRIDLMPGINYSWVGKTSYRVSNLKARGLLRMEAELIVYTHGWYIISPLQAFVSNKVENVQFNNFRIMVKRKIFGEFVVGRDEVKKISAKEDHLHGVSPWTKTNKNKIMTLESYDCVQEDVNKCADSGAVELTNNIDEELNLSSLENSDESNAEPDEEEFLKQLEEELS